MARVLLIDDDPSIRDLLHEVLERGGHEPSSAKDGEQGLKLLRSETFDLVVTDIVMPGKEGVETIQEIRRKWPLLPVLAMSGGGSVGDSSYLLIARAMGASAVLSKPFRNREFLAAVDKSLGENGD